MNEIWGQMQEWIFDPTVSKIIAVLFGIVIINVITRFALRTLLGRISSNDTRYRLRKGLNVLGIVASIILITVVFSNRLGSLTVAFGVAGAGIAFALQEVIASTAGWAAVAVGGFYSVGDRVQLGGITGDVIDIGVLRTTLMETGEWVKADQYNGRIVRVANSFVFTAPVFNYSADFPFLWDDITRPINYGSDHNLARELLQRSADDLLSAYAAEADATWQAMVL
jgi:small-conductance mechanosensitive channel